MKQEQAHIDQIRTAFEKMQSREDLLHLLNEVKPLIYGEKAVPFELKQLTWYANPKLGGKRYTEFKIKKKSGAQRIIHSPVKGLKAIQKTLAYILHCVYEPHKAAMGFVRERSIVDNAKIHVGNRYVYNIDLKDFFPSIDQSRVWKCLQLKPINLKDKVNYTFPSNIKDEKIIESLEFVDNFEQTSYAIFTDKTKALVSIKKGFKEINGEFHSIFDNDDTHQILPGWGLTEINGKPWIVDENDILGSLSYNLSRAGIADLIAKICCTELEVERKNQNGEWLKVLRNVIPQGAPTSPIISNIICQRLDYLLSGVAKRFGLKYSRYADDITFSSMHNVYQQDSEFLKELHRIIAEQGFHIKETKTRLQKDGYRKEVTGLLVNEKVNVQKRYIKQLRMWLYFWESYGYERASGFFLQQYIVEKGHIKNGKPDMTNVIAGKLDYLKMVKGADNELYLKMMNRFDKLIGTNTKSKNISEAEIVSKIDTNLVRISLEVYQYPEVNKKLYSSINIPKDTVLPSTIILTNSIAQTGDKKKIENNIYPILHTPFKTVELLKYFTANEKDLKYSTHSWEEGRYNNYEEYIEKIRFEWNEINADLKNLSCRLHAKISNYLFHDRLGQKNEKGNLISWGEMYLTFGWSSPELKIHMNEPGNSPFSCPIPDHIRKLDKKHNLYYFKNYADIFKNEIEFREDSSNFKRMILDLWENELGYDYFNVIGIEDLIGFSFFTDVHLIKAAFRDIFRDMFKGKREFPDVIIEKTSNFENGGYHLIKITQKGSFITRAVDDPKLTSPSGNLNSIIENLKNLADYSIVSRFGDGKNYRINYLTSTKTTFVDTLSENENVLGFTHEFKFYLL